MDREQFIDRARSVVEVTRISVGEPIYRDWTDIPAVIFPINASDELLVVRPACEGFDPAHPLMDAHDPGDRKSVRPWVIFIIGGEGPAHFYGMALPTKGT